jgi:hypothetical protein
MTTSGCNWKVLCVNVSYIKLDAKNMKMSDFKICHISCLFSLRHSGFAIMPLSLVFLVVVNIDLAYNLVLVFRLYVPL